VQRKEPMKKLNRAPIERGERKKEKVLGSGEGDIESVILSSGREKGKGFHQLRSKEKKKEGAG